MDVYRLELDTVDKESMVSMAGMVFCISGLGYSGIETSEEPYEDIEE